MAETHTGGFGFTGARETFRSRGPPPTGPAITGKMAGTKWTPRYHDFLPPTPGNTTRSAHRWIAHELDPWSTTAEDYGIDRVTFEPQSHRRSRGASWHRSSQSQRAHSSRRDRDYDHVPQIQPPRSARDAW